MTRQIAVDCDDVEQLATDNHSAEDVLEGLIRFGSRMHPEDRDDLVIKGQALTEATDD
jgi:hypothetical protein